MAPKRAGGSPSRQSQRLAGRGPDDSPPPSPGAWPRTEDEIRHEQEPIDPQRASDLLFTEAPNLPFNLERESAPGRLTNPNHTVHPSKKTTFSMDVNQLDEPVRTRQTSATQKQSSSKAKETGPNKSDFDKLSQLVYKMAERVDALCARRDEPVGEPSVMRTTERRSERYHDEDRGGSTNIEQDPEPHRYRATPYTNPTPRPRSPHRERDRTHTRDATPSQSAFGGNPLHFVPRGIAARTVFRPYADMPNPYERNPYYERRSKPTFPNPPTFRGKSEDFEPWIRHLSAKLKEDEECFKQEDSRMAYVMTVLGDEAERTLAARYDSGGFSCLAEMIQVLESTYLDPNQTSTARADLNRLAFKRGGDIHSFISNFNGLVYRARLPKDELKMLLWEHIPKSLDNALLGMAKDPYVSYETFCNRLTDSAYSDSLAYAERQSGRPTTREPTRERERTSRRAETPYRRPSTPELKSSNNLGRALSTDERQEHGKSDTCYTCGKPGHYSNNCPTKDHVKGGVRRVESMESVSSTSSDQSLKD